MLYNKFSIVLFAIRLASPYGVGVDGEEADENIRLYPGSRYQIQSNDYGFVIGPNEQALHEVSKWVSMRKHQQSNIFSSDGAQANDIEESKASHDFQMDAYDPDSGSRKQINTAEVMLPIAESLDSASRLFQSYGIEVQKSGTNTDGVIMPHVPHTDEYLIEARRALVQAEFLVQAARKRVDDLLCDSNYQQPLTPNPKESKTSKGSDGKATKGIKPDGSGRTMKATDIANGLKHHVVLVGAN